MDKRLFPWLGTAAFITPGAGCHLCFAAWRPGGRHDLSGRLLYPPALAGVLHHGGGRDAISSPWRRGGASRAHLGAGFRFRRRRVWFPARTSATVNRRQGRPGGSERAIAHGPRRHGGLAGQRSYHRPVGPGRADPGAPGGGGGKHGARTFGSVSQRRGVEFGRGFRPARAIIIDPTWKKHLQVLLERPEPNQKDPRDFSGLEVFERFTEFRQAVDLRPYSETTPAASSVQVAAAAPVNPAGNVGMEQTQGARKSEGEEQS